MVPILNKSVYVALWMLFFTCSLAHSMEMIVNLDVASVQENLPLGISRETAEEYLLQNKFSVRYSTLDEIDGFSRKIDGIEGDHQISGRIIARSEAIEKTWLTTSYIDVTLYFDKEDNVVVARIENSAAK